MSREIRLLIGYCIFFTCFNLAVSILYYLYGFFFEKKLRSFDQAVRLPAKMSFLFHFKGIYGEDKLNASRGGVLAQFGAIVYFLFMELLCFSLLAVLRDAVFPSRIAVFMCFVLILGGIIRFTMTNSSIKKNVKETERQTVKNFVEEKAVDKDEAEVDSDNILKESSSREKRMEQAMYELWKQENDHENETVNAQEGLDAVKKLESDVIGDDYEISAGSNLRKYNTEAESLEAVERNEEGVYSVSDFKENYQQEFSPVFVNNKKDADNASGLEEGKQYLESLKHDVKIKNTDAVSNEIEEGKKYLESLKKDNSAIAKKDSGKSSDLEEGRKYLESIKNNPTGENFGSAMTAEKSNEIEEGKKYLESLKKEAAVRNTDKIKKDGESELEEGKKYLEDLKRNVMKDDF